MTEALPQAVEYVLSTSLKVRRQELARRHIKLGDHVPEPVGRGREHGLLALVGMSVAHVGWRGTWLVYAGIQVTVALTLIVLLILRRIGTTDTTGTEP